MKDKWINIGYDGDELKPHTEPVEDLNDTTRIGKKDSSFENDLIYYLINHTMIMSNCRGNLC